ncbi:LysR family transcriptional regulator [Pseudomonas stutzeri]|uniref:LysR family transcriptional regulator n=1 Tax=Stutzerimonas stutzeri TaxID=316 RepID=UPI001F517A6F|nr:LysR family transcriptional regulator [Stutzerimonas stutzeri]MCI0916262.1 LysR family transcriptional regulator [Stutzerimonas stutzeri]
MRYRRLDLNLLVALDALLDERSVSRAAERLHLGQSATSAALGRLREHFGDPLLAPVGRRLEPTALARSLQPKVREALRLAREIVEEPLGFEPGECQRHFSLATSDYVAAVLLPAVSRTLAREAPGVRLSIRDLPRPRDGDVVSEALEYRQCDLVIVPPQRSNAQYPQADLLSDELCCIVSADSGHFPEGLSLADYRAAEHVVREFADGQQQGMDAVHLRELGIKRRVAVAVGNFALMAEFVVGTARVATLFRRQAEALAARYPLRVVPAPRAFPATRQVLQWHPHQDLDPALGWLRGLLAEHAARLDQAAG